ncbi:hypothetical protein [Aliikangiella sp. IMCC44359]|uniref:hypothetical protein n=1 Tax=Aliikangiella sp. IMCC44359 TaxID=3459125 RepID=UPI00403B1664
MTIRVAMIGLGNVNRNLLTILSNKKDRLKNDFQIEFKVVCVADSSGIAVDSNGYNPEQICALKVSGKKVRDFSGYLSEEKIETVMQNIDCDLIFEASPVDLKTGGAGLTVSRIALQRGISVVLANKAPLVLAFQELHLLAKKNHAGLRYSATVCGGLPVINIGQRDMIAANVTKLCGIFNSTSNFILDEMAIGRSYTDALAEAQRLGIAEADPSLDVEGWDTANKLAIIANSILNYQATLQDIKVEGITHITTEMLQRERAQGRVIRLLAIAENDSLSVKPTPIREEEFLANCSGWEMGVEIHSDIYGIMYHKLWEREPVPTAASMLRDAVNICCGHWGKSGALCIRD